jgi:galactonate dehydratase
LKQVKLRVKSRVAGGERLYTIPDFYRLVSQRAADVIQMDVAHCGGILASKKVAAIATAEDLLVSPHCSIGPVALAAALHFDLSTPNFMIQEAFGEFDVSWRAALVGGWNPIQGGYFYLADEPGLGVDIDIHEISRHPYKRNSFPSLWDKRWYEEFSLGPDSAVT